MMLFLYTHQCICEKIRNYSCVLFEYLLFNIAKKQISVTWANLCSHCFPSHFLLMLIHHPVIHFAPPPRLLVDFKNRKLLTYFGSYYALFCICYCFSHVIGLLEMLDCNIRIGSAPIFISFDLYLYSPTQDWVCIYIYNFVYLLYFCCLGIYQKILSGK